MHRRIVVAATLIALIAAWLALAPACGAQSERGRATLGVAVEPSAPTAEHEGVEVQRVYPQGPAEKAGLRRGDVITRLDSHPVDDAETLINLLAQHRPGDQIEVRVDRGGQTRKFTVTLGERSQTARAPRGKAEAGGEEEQSTGPAARKSEGKQMPLARDDDEARSRPAWLGVMTVSVQDLSRRMRDRLGIETSYGLLVQQVLPDSPAARAGLHNGDVITGINGQEVTTQRQLAEAVRRAGPGRQVRLAVSRGEEEKKEMTAHLEEAPTDMAFGAAPARADEQDVGRQVQQLQREVEQLRERVRELEQAVRSTRTGTPPR